MMTCNDCGHSLEVHGPHGCLGFDIDRDGISHQCRCTEPGLQAALDLGEVP